MKPWQVDPNWYQRYWLEEHPGSMQARIGIAAKRIVRLFRPLRNSGSASVDAASAIVTRPHRSVMPWSLGPRMSRIKLSAYWPG